MTHKFVEHLLSNSPNDHYNVYFNLQSLNKILHNHKITFSKLSSIFFLKLFCYNLMTNELCLKKCTWIVISISKFLFSFAEHNNCLRPTILMEHFN